MNTDDIFKGRIRELASAAAYGGRFCFTDFLNAAELSYVKSIQSSLPCDVSFSGGYETAERVIARFGSAKELGYEEEFPIVVIHISPLNPRFSDKLTHRDFLGAAVNLGIDRRLTGDILTDGTQAWLFAEAHIAPFIEENLTRVKHTAVSAKKTAKIPDGIISAPEEICVICPSLRLDAVISKVFNISRKEADNLFAAEKIFVNSVVQTKPSHVLKEGDTVSARGLGRFKYIESAGDTRKGNIKIRIMKY